MASQLANRAPALRAPLTAALGAISVGLGLATELLAYSHVGWAAAAMVAAVLATGVAFVLLLGWRVGLVALLILTCMIDRHTFAVGRFNIRPEQVAAIVALVALVANRLREGALGWLRPTLAEAALLAWFAIGLVSSLTAAPDRGTSLKVLALLVISSLALFLPRRLLEDDRDRLERVVALLLLGFAVESIYAVATYFLHLFGPTVLLAINPAGGHLEAFGTLWEPNVLGAVCGAGAVAWAYLGRRYFGHPWLGVALCLAASVVSFARAAWLAVIIVFALSLATSVRRRIDLGALGAGAAATAVLSVVVVATDKMGNYSPAATGVVSALGNGTDVTGRLNQLGPVFADLGGKLRLVVGGGTNSFAARHVLNGVPQHLANLELMVLNDTGLIGVLLFGLFGIAIVLAVWRYRKDTIVLGLGAMMLVLAMTNTATETLELMVTWLLIGLLLAAIEVAPSSAG